MMGLSLLSLIVGMNISEGSSVESKIKLSKGHKQNLAPGFAPSWLCLSWLYPLLTKPLHVIDRSSVSSTTLTHLEKN